LQYDRERIGNWGDSGVGVEIVMMNYLVIKIIKYKKKQIQKEKRL